MRKECIDKMQKITINTMRLFFCLGCVVLSTYHMCDAIIQYILGREPMLLELLYKIIHIASLAIGFFILAVIMEVLIKYTNILDRLETWINLLKK